MPPKKVIIISGDRKVVIDKDGWTGKPINVVEVNKRVTGTVVEFVDEKPWDFETVEKHAVFSGMTVIIDGKQCETAAFCSDSAVLYKKPGCRIEVLENISEHHSKWTDGWHGDRVLVNFHGQVVQLDWWPAERHRGLNILIDIVERTEIRLMLPARTRLVENAALEKLKTSIELEYYKYYQRQDKHTLNYKEYLRARQLGIELSEAEPQFAPGLICDEYDMPVEVAMPEGFELKDCYLCFADELAETNAQLLFGIG